MTQRMLILLLFFCFQTPSFTQTDLNTAVHNLAGKIGPVSAAKYDYNQKLSTVNQPYAIKFYISQTSTNGKTDEEEYYFNLADIEPSSVRYQTVKDVIRINIKTKNNQRYIKKFENGELNSYTNSIDLAAENAENAREIQTLLKEAIQLAEAAIKDDLALADWNSGMQYLKTQVQGATIGETSYTYTITQDPVVEPRITIDIAQKGGKNPTDERYRFNLADLNAQKVAIGVSGTTPYVELETQSKLKYIYASKNGIPQNYGSSLKLPCGEIDQAREWVAVFQFLIENAPDQNESWKPNLENGESALLILAQLVGKVPGESTTYEQKLSTTCPCSLTQQYDDKGTSVEETYLFNWADLDPNKSKLQVSGSNLYFNLATRNNEKLIQASKNGSVEEYTRSAKILLSHPEPGKVMEDATALIIPYCEQSLENLIGDWSSNERMDWLKNNIKTVSFQGETLTQKWEPMDPNDPCSFRLEQTQSGKNTKTETIEFFGKDLDPKGLRFETSGKEIGLRINTKNRQKLIKVIEEGEEQPYVNSILIIFDSLENTRIAKEIFTALANDCK